MVVRRAASIFSMIGILAASSIATGPAAAAPASDIARKGTVVAAYLTLDGTARATDSQPEDVTALPTSSCHWTRSACSGSTMTRLWRSSARTTDVRASISASTFTSGEVGTGPLSDSDPFPKPVLSPGNPRGSIQYGVRMIAGRAAPTLHVVRPLSASSIATGPAAAAPASDI